MHLAFKELRVWKEAIDLCLACEAVAKGAQDEHNYGLADQVRRSALSIPSNIAEGKEGGTDGIYLRHVRIALGSSAELRTQVIIANKLGYIDKALLDQIEDQLNRVVLPLYKLRSYLYKERSTN